MSTLGESPKMPQRYSQPVSVPETADLGHAFCGCASDVTVAGELVEIERLTHNAVFSRAPRRR